MLLPVIRSSTKTRRTLIRALLVRARQCSLHSSSPLSSPLSASFSSSCSSLSSASFSASTNSCSCTSSSSTSPASAAPSSETLSSEAPTVQPKIGKLKLYWRQYGWTFVGTYATVYVSTVAAIYVLLSRGYFGVPDVEDLAKIFGWEKWLEQMNPRTGNLALAWAVSKIIEPVRLAASAMITPPLARKLGFAPKKDPNQRLVHKLKQKASQKVETNPIQDKNTEEKKQSPAKESI
eukprot:TRINITY_DN6602_c0_g1_i1.p1 TRINITY_DN6602_c0_g1~~TRINITY_DN6602_c0_g1_i1.p1  ORF type:complete len:235 (+),score=49.33 TRINITY_DN6602_c0_g1_i1:53-757(+)